MLNSSTSPLEEHSVKARGPARLILALLLVLGVVLVFGQALSFDFLSFDDPEYVIKNVHVRRGLTLETVRWAWVSTDMAIWHPLTWMTHALDVTLWKLNPAGHHLGNVLLHAASTTILFLALDRLTRARWRSFLVAALFGLHPLRADSIAWVAERKDALSTFFTILTLYAYVAYAEARTLKRYLAVIVFFALALLAKPMAVVFPAALLLLDYWPLGRLTRPDRLRCLLEKLPLFLLGGAAALVTLRAHAPAITPLPLRTRAATAVISYAQHLGRVFYPHNLSILYPNQVLVGGTIPMWHVVVAVVVIVLIAAIAVVTARRTPYIAFGVTWFAVLFFPVCGIIQSGPGAGADRFTYVPCIGVLIAAVWFASAVFNRWRAPTPLRAAVGSAVVLAYAVAAYVTVGTYRDTITVFTHAIASTGKNWMAEDHLGYTLLYAGDMDGAARHFRAEMLAAPGHWKGFNGLGQVLQAQGKTAEALQLFEHAVALEATPKSLNDYCMSLLEADRKAEAFKCLTNAVGLDPNAPLAYVNLAKLFNTTGRSEKALALLNVATRLDPTDAKAQSDKGATLLTLHREEAAVSCLEKAIELDPSAPVPYLNLAMAYDRLGQPERAANARDMGERLRRMCGGP